MLLRSDSGGQPIVGLRALSFLIQCGGFTALCEAVPAI